MAKRQLIILLVVSIQSACNNSGNDTDLSSSGLNEIRQYLLDSAIEALEHPNGFFYLPDTGANDTTPLIKEGDIVRFEYAVANLGLVPFEIGSDSTANSVVGRVGNSAITPQGLDQGLLLMRKGQLFTFYLPHHLAYQGVSLSPLQPRSNLELQVKVLDILVDSMIRESEDDLIENIIDTRGLRVVQETDNDSLWLNTSGLQVKVIRNGDSIITIEQGDLVDIEYELFAASEPSRSITTKRSLEFIVGDGSVFKGLNEELVGLKLGMDASIFLPSAFGYDESVLIVPKLNGVNGTSLSEVLADDLVIPAYAVEIEPFQPIELKVRIFNITKSADIQ